MPGENDWDMYYYLLNLVKNYREGGLETKISEGGVGGMINEVYLYPFGFGKFDLDGGIAFNNHVHIYYYKGNRRRNEPAGWSYHYSVCDGYNKLHLNQYDDVMEEYFTMDNLYNSYIFATTLRNNLFKLILSRTGGTLHDCYTLPH